MKLSEVKDEAALDLLADLIEPAAEIVEDPEIQKLINTGRRAAIIKLIIKNHKKSIIEILAAIDGIPVEEYHVNVFTLPLKLIDLFNDQELISFFTSAVEERTTFTDTLENTEDLKE